MNALAKAPWQRVIAHATAVEVAARRLLDLLKEPESIDCLPSIGWLLDGRAPHQFLEEGTEYLNKLIERAKLGRETQTRQRARFSAHLDVGADTMFIGGHLPLIYRILYGEAVKGEAPGGNQPSRARFISACCMELDLPVPADKAIEAARTKYRKAYAYDGAGLGPPRNPSQDCMARIDEWLAEISTAEVIATPPT